MRSTTIQLRRKGTMTLPQELRRRYQFGEGDRFTLTDLGQGSILLTPGVSETARLIDEAAAAVAEQGVSLEALLETLDEERVGYYRDHFASS